MDVMIATFSQENVAHDHRFLARGWPAGQTEQCAPITFMHDTVADEVVILTMIEHRQPDHARVLDRPPHQLVVLDTAAVIRSEEHTSELHSRLHLVCRLL